MKPLPLLFAGLAVFALGAWVSAPYFHQALDEEAQKSKAPPRSDSTGGITLGDALQLAEEKFASVDHLHDRTIGALWKANENGAKYIYADIWPPYQGESPPPNNTFRLAIRVDHQGVAKWTWIQGTELVTYKSPPKFRRSTTLYPEGHLGPSVTIDHAGRVLYRQGPKSQ